MNKRLWLFVPILIIFLTVNYSFKMYQNLTSNNLLLPTYYFHADNIYLLAQGSWIEQTGTKLANIQTTKILCERATMLCTVANATQTRNKFLDSDIETIELAEWGPNIITSKPQQFECVKYTYDFDVFSNTVSAIREKTDSTASCSSIESKTMYLKLEDGQKRVSLGF